MIAESRHQTLRRARAVACLIVAAYAVAGCSHRDAHAPARLADTSSRAGAIATRTGDSPPQAAGHRAGVDRLAHLLPGMPPPLSATDAYRADRPMQMSPTVAGDRSLIYVPNSESDTVDEIDPKTFRIVRHFAVGRLPQHVVPSWNLRTLWIANDEGNSLTAIDPRTGAPGRTVPVDDPYNLYFTPDGKFAIVVAEQRRRLDFRDPKTMALRHALHVPCAGVDHLDYTADGRFLLASCEFAGRMVVVDVARQRVVRTVFLPDPATPQRLRSRSGAGMPQDVKLAPDGAVFYVADMMANGVYVVDATSFRVRQFIATGHGTHGLYVDRQSRFLYVTNRLGGSVSLLDLRTRRVARTWHLPGGGSPDMGGVSADGRTLWLSGRYNAEVYAIDTRTGRLRARIKVGRGPHGLSVFPQPGRYSLGHTGVFR